MNAITLRNIPTEIARMIQKRAKESGESLNKTVVHLLEQQSTTDKKRKTNRCYHDLDHLAGTWAKKETTEFEKTLASQRQIETFLWK